jgi:hypothetical protein
MLLAMTLYALIFSACNTDAPLVTAITIDFPHGALRLIVQRDDETSLLYGALPTYRTVHSTTFNIDDLFQQLQPRLHDNVPAENRPIGEPYGMVIIDFSDDSEQDFLIYDETFAVGLFRAACANLVQEEKFNAEIITAECIKLEGATP